MAKPKITVYASINCPACVQAVPMIKKLAVKYGVTVQIKDVDKCKRSKSDPICRKIGYVPTVVHEGREVPLEILDIKMKMLGRRG